MKKKTKRLIIVGVLLVVVIALLFVVMELVKEDEDQDRQVEPVSQTEVLDIEGITYTSPSTSGEAVTLVREDDIWYYEEDKEFPLDQKYVTNNMVLTAAETVADKELEGVSGQLSDYGLDKPYVTIILKKITGDEVKMSIGAYNESVEGYYLKIDGRDSLYLVDGQLPFAFDMSVYEIADMEDYPYVEVNSITHIKVENDNGVSEFQPVVKDNAASYVTEQYYLEKEKTWQVSKNGAAYKDGNQESITEFLTQLTSIDYASMIEYRADEKVMAQYGIDKECVLLTVDYEILDENTARQVEGADGITEIVCDSVDVQYVLRIGDKVPEDGFSDPAYYVSLEGSNVVYTISAESISYIMDMNASNYQ